MSSARRGRGTPRPGPAVREEHASTDAQSGTRAASSPQWMSTMRPQATAQSSSAAIPTASASASASCPASGTSDTTSSAGAGAASASASQTSGSSATSERRTSTRLALKRERHGDTDLLSSKGRYGKRSGRDDFVNSASDSE